MSCELIGTKIKPANDRFGLRLLIGNLENNNLITDVGSINYTEGEQLLSSTDLSSLTPITEPFCDNIVVVKIGDVADTEGEKNKRIVQRDICGAFNRYLRGKFSKFESSRLGVKANLPFLLQSDTRISQRIRGVMGQEAVDDCIKKFQQPIVIPYKIELADVKLETLLDEMTNILIELKRNDYYLVDFDITQDFAGIFNKTEMCNYLTSTYDFCYHGEYKENYNVIINNDRTVGIDCLAWLTPNNDRVKIYNKFICQITSPGVNKMLGNHIVDFIHCPNSRLRETFSSSLAKEHGITRLEATIYNSPIGCDKFYPVTSCVEILEKSKRYFRDSPIYSVSIPKMWTKLADSLQNSCCVVFNNLLRYVYWGNMNTRKLTGLQITLPDDQVLRRKAINYALSAFGFNYLPINYLEIAKDVEDNAQILQKCYIKSGETFFSRSSTLFSTISETLSLEDVGLVNTKNVVPQVLRKRANMHSRLTPHTLKEIEPLFSVNMLCVKKRKLELDEVDVKRRKLERMEKTASVKEEYKNLLEAEKKVNATRDKLVKIFSRPWKQLGTSGYYNVSAFTVNTKSKVPLVGILAENDGEKNVYFLRGLYEDWFVNVYNSRDALKQGGFMFVSYNGSDIILLASEEPFISFETNGVESSHGSTLSNVENFKIDEDVWKNMDKAPNKLDELDSTMHEIKGNIKVVKCRRLEELEDGVELLIRGIKKISHRNKDRYILQFQNISPLYVSNYWLEKEINDSEVDLSSKIKIRLGGVKTTVHKHMERMVFCI